MTAPEIREAIFAVLAQIAPDADPASLKGSENLRETLEIDSFDFLNLLIGLNQKLGVAIPESDYAQLSTLDSLIRYLEAATSPPAPSARTALPPPPSA